MVFRWLSKFRTQTLSVFFGSSKKFEVCTPNFGVVIIEYNTFSVDTFWDFQLRSHLNNNTKYYLIKLYKLIINISILMRSDTHPYHSRENLEFTTSSKASPSFAYDCLHIHTYHTWSICFVCYPFIHKMKRSIKFFIANSCGIQSTDFFIHSAMIKCFQEPIHSQLTMVNVKNNSKITMFKLISLI